MRDRKRQATIAPLMHIGRKNRRLASTSLARAPELVHVNEFITTQSFRVQRFRATFRLEGTRTPGKVLDRRPVCARQAPHAVEPE